MEEVGINCAIKRANQVFFLFVREEGGWLVFGSKIDEITKCLIVSKSDAIFKERHAVFLFLNCPASGPLLGQKINSLPERFYTKIRYFYLKY